MTANPSKELLPNLLRSRCMASGGGPPPSHLSIPQLPFVTSAVNTLQTPHLTLTTPASATHSGVDSTGKSFTSLEELLNITGINTPEGGRPDNGVSSLTKIAQAVENRQNGVPDDVPSAAKKPRLDSPSTPTQPNVTIASLLHKKLPVSTNPTPTTSSTVAQALLMLTQALSASSSLLQGGTSAPSQTGSNPVIPSLVNTQQATSPTGSNSKSFLLQLVQLYKHYQSTGDSEGMERIKKQLNTLVTASQGRSVSNPLLSALSMLNTTSATTQQTSSVVGTTGTLSTSQTSLTTSGPAVTHSNVPPSLLGATRSQTTPTGSKLTTSQVNSTLAEQISVQQKAVRQLQSIMASLPVNSRPKTAQEIRDFVQKYSGLITQLQAPSSQSNKPTATLPPGSVAVPLTFRSTAPTSSSTSISTTAMAQVDQHFQTALTAVKKKVPPNAQFLAKPLPAIVDLTTESESSATVSAPVTTQFKPPAVSKGSKPGSIQAGVATPLPPGLTLETLAVLCRLPETELEKLKLPVGLLSAIKVWKEKQPAKKGGSAQLKSNNVSSSNIPVLFPPTSLSGHAPKGSATLKVGDAVSLTSSGSGGDFKKPFVIPSNVGFPPRSLHALIPGVGQGSSIGAAAAASRPATTTPHRSGVTLSRLPNPSPHMTRVRVKADQERAEKERLQALTKVLMSSEEAQIAFLFNSHLDKMHSQLMTPDTTTPFSGRQDVLARLLPYHVYAQCEPPAAAVEKADAVFESVAQVLLSRSRGLQSQFQQMLAKTDSQGGSEVGVMELELQRCFLEGERERVQQEKLQKQQAQQVAADLSMMVKDDGRDTFDSEFSLSDAFFPFLGNGVT